MTYIEFFGRESIENISTCLTGAPERVVFIGQNRRLMEKQAMRYRMVLLGRGQDVEFICREVPKNDLRAIIDALAGLVETFGACSFDLTGGDELYLVATGIIYDRYREVGIQLHRFSIRENRVIDCDEQGCVLTERLIPEFTVEENIRIYGGDIIYENEKAGGTHVWKFSEELFRDVSAIWDVCRKDVKAWNRVTSILAIASSLNTEHRDPLTITAPIKALLTELKKAGLKNESWEWGFKALHRAGVLTAYSADEKEFSFTAKNAEIKHCLTKAGQILELAVWAAASAAGRDTEDGKPVYNDVMTGVFIDWDGNLSKRSNAVDTENEIDVLMMRGLVPVFVSCKNGNVNTEELYKLNTVAEQFGGKYAKKVLVATALGETGFAAYFRQRALDMGIRLIESAAELSLEELTDLSKTFYRRVD